MSFGSGTELGFGISVALDNQVSAPSHQIVKDLQNVGRATDELSNKLTSNLAAVESVTKGYQDTIQRSQTQIMSGMTLMAGGMAALAPIGFGIQMAGEFEKAEIRINTFTRSAAKTKEIMDTLKKDAAATPFSFKELLGGETALISTGLNAEKAREDILNLGNAIAAVGGGADELNRMSINMQQVRQMGKASSMDLKQFAMTGINVYGLLSDTLGKSVAEIKEMDITYEMITNAFKSAAAEGGIYEGAMENLSRSIFGKFSTLRDNVEQAMAEVGSAVMPLMHKIIDLLISATNHFKDFVSTPVGKYITMITAAVGGLLFVMGSLLVVTGFVRMAHAQLALTFIKMLPATIAQTFATSGLTAAMTALAVSIWAAMAPLWPFIAAAAAAVGIIYLLMSVIGTEGNQWEKFTTLIDGVFQVFSSWNGESAILSRETKDSLEKYGLLEFFQNMSTWIVRIKEFGKGFFDPLIQTAGDMFAIFSPIGDLFNAFVELLKTMGFDIGKATGEVSGFNTVGQILGNVFFIALIPIRIMANVLGFLVRAFTWIIQKVREAIIVFRLLNNSIKGPESGWIFYMIQGIKLLLVPFEAFFHMIKSIIGGLSMLGDAFSGIGDALGFTVKNEGPGNVKPSESKSVKKSIDTSQKIAETLSTGKATRDNTGSQKPRAPQPIIINHTTVVDGETVAKSSNKYNQQQDGRSE